MVKKSDDFPLLLGDYVVDYRHRLGDWHCGYHRQRRKTPEGHSLYREGKPKSWGVLAERETGGATASQLRPDGTSEQHMLLQLATVCKRQKIGRAEKCLQGGILPIFAYAKIKQFSGDLNDQC